MERTASRASLALRAWREQLGLTQTEAAERIGLTQGRYSQFEVGSRRPGRRWAGVIEERTKGLVQVLDWDRAVERQRKAA